jgi:hypothetical protein
VPGEVRIYSLNASGATVRPSAGAIERNNWRRVYTVNNRHWRAVMVRTLAIVG